MQDQGSALLLTWPAWAGYLGSCALAASLQNSSGVIGWWPMLFQGHGKNKGLNVSGMVIKWIREWYKYFIQGEKWPGGEIFYTAWLDEAAEIRCKNQRWGTKIWSLSVCIIIYCGQMKSHQKRRRCKNFSSVRFPHLYFTALMWINVCAWNGTLEWRNMSGITQVIREPNSGCEFEVSMVSNVIGYYFKLEKKRKKALMTSPLMWIAIKDPFASQGAIETKPDIAQNRKAVVQVKQIICIALCLASHSDQKLMPREA